jgi:hypothetical protein
MLLSLHGVPSDGPEKHVLLEAVTPAKAGIHWP